MCEDDRERILTLALEPVSQIVDKLLTKFHHHTVVRPVGTTDNRSIPVPQRVDLMPRAFYRVYSEELSREPKRGVDYLSRPRLA